MTHLVKAAAAAALLACGATYAFAQSTPAPAAKSDVQKSQANDPQSGGVATTPKGTAGPASSDATSQASKDKSKMDDPRSGAVPDKSGAATGTGAGTGAPTPGTGPNPTGMSKEKQKSEANDPGEGGKKQ
jgi:hypothetical protein